MNQNRLKSPVVWIAIAAQILAILVALGVIDTSFSETINTAIVAFIQVLVILGVLNNPTDSDGF